MPQKSAGGGYGGQRSGNVGSNFGGGSGRMGGNGGGSKPSGPGFSPMFDSLTPNGLPPATGVLGGVAMLGNAIVNGDVNPYGRPTGWADMRSRDLGGIGRGNAGGGDARGMGGMMGGGMGRIGGQLHPAVLQHLTANNPKLASFFASRGTMAPQAPAAPTVAPTAPQSTQQTVPAATLGGPVPGLSDYTMQAPSYGYFGAPGQTRGGIRRAASLGGY